MTVAGVPSVRVGFALTIELQHVVFPDPAPAMMRMTAGRSHVVE